MVLETEAPAVMPGGSPAKSVHPGSGRRRTRETPKGRQVDAASLAEVELLVVPSARRVDLLIENLHVLQDRYGCLHARHLAALAQLMRTRPGRGL